MINETEDKRYGQEAFIPARVPDEYKQAMYQQLQHSFGLQVFKVLQESRLPAVIDFKEETIPVYDNYEPGERVRFTMMINPVEHHHVTIAHYEPTNLALMRDAIGEIKYRVSRKIKGMLGKAGVTR